MQVAAVEAEGPEEAASEEWEEMGEWVNKVGAVTGRVGTKDLLAVAAQGVCTYSYWQCWPTESPRHA